jgi:hypothetical protein
MRGLLLALAGCGGLASKDATTVDGGGGTSCAFAEPDDLPDVENGLFGEEHACEEQPIYDDYSDYDWLTVWYVGEFDIDGCGVVSGEEIWKIYPSPQVQDQGMTDCEIVFSVNGTRGEPVLHGDFSLAMTADIDLDATDCAILGGIPFWEGYETYELSYDVDVDDGGAAAVWYPPSELNEYLGKQLGTGYGNESHVSYLSDFVCSPYTSN